MNGSVMRFHEHSSKTCYDPSITSLTMNIAPITAAERPAKCAALTPAIWPRTIIGSDTMTNSELAAGGAVPCVQALQTDVWTPALIW